MEWEREGGGGGGGRGAYVGEGRSHSQASNSLDMQLDDETCLYRWSMYRMSVTIAVTILQQ